MKTVSIIILFIFAQVAHADALCGDKPKEHDLIIGESEFTFDNAMSATVYIRDEIPVSIIKNHDSLKNLIKSKAKIESTDLFESDIALEKAFFMDYPNNFSIITGTLLRQNALLLKYKYQLSKKPKDKVLYKKALKEFCELEKDASYVD